MVDTRFEGGAYRDVKDYTNSTAEPFEDQIKKNLKKKKGSGFTQLELELTKRKNTKNIDAFRSKTTESGSVNDNTA